MLAPAQNQPRSQATTTPHTRRSFHSRTAPCFASPQSEYSNTRRSRPVKTLTNAAHKAARPIDINVPIQTASRGYSRESEMAKTPGVIRDGACETAGQKFER